MLTFLLVLASLVSFSPTRLFSGDPDRQLTIQVVGLESSEGQVQVAVFNKADTFLENPCHQQLVDVNSSSKLEVSLTIPEGEYAVAVYHDANRNQELDKNFFGMPTEAYGFSNNARGSALGPPSFEDAKFPVNQTTQIVRINLR